MWLEPVEHQGRWVMDIQERTDDHQEDGWSCLLPHGPVQSSGVAKLTALARGYQVSTSPTALPSGASPVRLGRTGTVCTWADFIFKHPWRGRLDPDALKDELYFPILL